MTPKLLAPGRRWPLAGLAALAILEAAALTAAALAVTAAIAGGADAGVRLVTAAIGSALIGALRLVAAEDFGMRYANAMRALLAHHAVAVASAGRSRRLGALAARLTGDLNALRDWAALGVGDMAAAAAAATAGLIVLGLALGVIGLAIGGGGLLACALIAALLSLPLRATHRKLRRDRGAVAGLAGEIVTAGATLAAFDAEAREVRRLSERADQLRRTAVMRRVWAAAIAAPAAAFTGLGVLAAIALGAGGATAHWPMTLMGLGALAMAALAAARATDAFWAFAIARERLALVAREAQEAQPRMAPRDTPRARKASLRVSLDRAGAQALKPGSVLWVRRDSVEAGLRAVLALSDRAEGAFVDGAAIAALNPRDAARWFPLASPKLPLLAGSLRRNLAIGRRDVDDAALNTALALAGLELERWPLDRLIDPTQLDDEEDAARLRLARALAHRPKTLFIAERALMTTRDYEQRITAIAKAARAGVVACALPAVAADADQPSAATSPG